MSDDDGEITVHGSTVCRWANRFHGSCVSRKIDSRPGRPRTSTDERSVKLVADALEEDRRVTREERSRATEEKTSQEYAREPTSAGPLILHNNARPQIVDVVTKKSARL